MNIYKIIIFLALFFLPLQLKSQVHEEWDVKYRGAYDNFINSKIVKYDSYGNVYVLAYSSVNAIANSITIKYNNRGEMQWVSRISAYPVALGIDNAGNVYVSGATSDGGVICKYSSFGVMQWQVTKNYYLNDMVVDDFGNIYITGYGVSGINAGIQTRKYNSSGTLIWEQLHVSSNSGNYGYRIKLDNAGNVYTLGEWRSTNSYDIRVYKYNNNGQYQWTGIASQSFDISYYDFAGLGIDDNGCVYIGGTLYSQSSKLDYIVVKLNPTGNESWYKIFNSEYSFDDKPAGMEVNGRGDVYITGQSFFDTLNNRSKVTTIKYDSSGILKWKNDYANSNGYVFPAAIAKDILGNIYVTINNSNYTKITTVKYDSTGNLKWSADYIGATMQTVVRNISADNYGNIYLCGGTSGTQYPEALTIRYLQSWNSNFTVTGLVTYLDNGQPVDGGYVKAVKLDKITGNIINVDSTPIQINGYYSLKHIIQDSLYLIAYPAGNQTFVPTYFQQSINWKNAQKLFASSNISEVNVSVYRITAGSGDCTLKGIVVKTERNFANLKDAFIYVKNGSEFIKYSVTDGNGLYQINSVQPGMTKIYADRLGYSSDSLSINLVSGNIYDNLNFNLKQDYVGIIKVENKIPIKYILHQNYPNPFNPVTKIKYELAKNVNVKILVYDMLGREIMQLVNDNKKAGVYEVEMNAVNLSAGVYFCKIQAGEFTDVKKMILIK